MRFFTAAGLLAFAAAASAAAQGPEDQRLTVQTASGTVEGVVENGLEAWLGLPYASPPTGPLRWRPPAPVKSWVGVRKASTLPGSCSQNGDLGVFAKAGGSEDCLYLNIYRPAGGVHDKLPVLVWIHGGALLVGQGADYDPSKLATDGKSIVVTLNYRLGSFGFFAHPALAREGHPVGNYGLMDQQAALAWLQRNIAAFGGDPANVTIAGESSGGNSVMAHIASPTAAGTFQNVVAMSGGALMLRHPAFGAALPIAEAEKAGLGLAKAAGCERGGAKCLRSLSASQLLAVQTPFSTRQVIIDGTILPGHPGDIYRNGQVNKVNLISGSTRDEGRFFAALTEIATGKPMTADTYPRELEAYYGAELAPRVAREYPLDRYNNASEAYSAAVTDSLFSCPGRAAQTALSARIPVYAYEFSDATAPSYAAPTTFPLLAAHTFEIPYVFLGFRGGGDAKVVLNPLQAKLSDQMVGYFAAANRLGAPGTAWQAYRPEVENVMNFALPQGETVTGAFAKFHRCDFWATTGIY